MIVGAVDGSGFFIEEDAEPVEWVVLPVARVADRAVRVVQNTCAGEVVLAVELPLVDCTVAEVVLPVLFPLHQLAKRLPYFQVLLITMRL